MLSDGARRKKNVADTMASLLALLTHNAGANEPPEPAAEVDDASPAALPIITSKAIIFILDHFEAFTTHSRQTLLYNLFDVATFHPPGAPAIAVIGMTSVLNVTDLLEKRVKSRFSHRTLFLRSPASMTEYWERVRQHLMIHDSDSASINVALSMQDKLRAVASPAAPLTAKPPSSTPRWNSALSDLHPGNPAFTSLLLRIQAQTRDPRPLLSQLLLPLSSLTAPCRLSNPSLLHFLPTSTSSSFLGPSLSIGNLSALLGLSTTSLSLLIAAARLSDFRAHPHVTYTSVYREYEALVNSIRTSAAVGSTLSLSTVSPSKSPGGAGAAVLGKAGFSGARLFSKAAARGAFEELVAAELLTPDSVSGEGGLMGSVGGATGSGTGGGEGGSGQKLGSRSWERPVMGSWRGL